METLNKVKKEIQLFSCILIFLVSLTNCKKEEKTGITTGDKPSLTGVVLFVVGDVQSAGKKIKSGDIIAENESIKTGKKSTCDIQIKELDVGIVMRMKSDSNFQLKSATVNGQQVPSPIVSVGSAMINVSGKLKSGENFQVLTPTTVAGVRGTKFEILVAKDGSTSLSVSEGKVATRVRIEEAEELPQEIQEKSIAISSVKKSLESQEKVLEAGEKVEITKTQSEKILKDSGLKETIKQIQTSNTQAKLSTEDIQVAVNSLDKNIQSTGNEKSIEINSSIKVEKISDKNLQAQLKEFSELIAIEKKKLETNETTVAALKERNEKNQETLTKRIEEITGKKFETLILKTGKKVKGSIFLEGETYFVITPDGQEAYKEEEVEGMEL